MTVCKVVDFLYLTFIPLIFEVIQLKELKSYKSSQDYFTLTFEILWG